MKTSKLLLALVLGSSGSLLGSALVTTDARAQSATTGAIQGRVTDQSNGAPLAGVTVVVSGASSQTTITEDDGTYRVTDLTPGEYLVTFFFGELTIERRGIQVGVNKTVPVFQKINVASAVQETIVIDDKPPAIDPTSTTQGITIDQEYTKNIPVPGRTFESTLGAAAGSQGDSQGVAFSGSSSAENQYVVDGVSTTGLKYGTGGSPILNEFIEEIEVITGGYNAEYGRATGGVVNVVTLTGTNELEGKVWAYVTPGVLTADRNVAASQASSIDATSNLDLATDGGFTLTGPIIKDKAWFAVGVAPQYSLATITRTTKRRRDCQELIQTGPNAGQLSPCVPGLGQDQFSDSFPDVDPATGFFIYEDLSETKLRPYAFGLATLGKINFAVKPEHQGQITANFSPAQRQNYAVYGLSSTGDAKISGMTLDLGAKWTSKFHDNKTEVEAVLGWHRETVKATPDYAPSADNPFELLLLGNLGNWSRIVDPRSGQPREDVLTQNGCIDGAGTGDPYEFITNCPDEGIGYRVGGFGTITDDISDRYAAKLGLTRRQKFFGNHEIKAGVDIEDNRIDEPRAFTGDRFFINYVGQQIESTRWIQVAPQGSEDPKFDDNCSYTPPNAMAPVQLPCRFIEQDGEGSRIQGETINWSAFLRDSWQIRPNITLNAGLRYEEQRLRFAEYLRDETDPLTNRPYGTNAMVLRNMWAPRVGLLYDWTREGRSKVYGHWGRFFESVPLDINARSFGGEVSYSQVYDPADCTMGSPPDGYGGASGNNCDPEGGATDVIGVNGTIVAPGIKPQYMDEAIFGVEYELMEDLKLGMAYQNRTLGRVIEDVSTDGADTYIIANPGEWDPEEEDAYQAQIDAAIAAGDMAEAQRLSNLLRQFQNIRLFDTPSRTYNALQLTVTRRFSKALYMQGSYTYSKTKGNFPGLISYDNGQLDPNISSQYDLIELLANRYGPLPQDRPHYIKLDGYYSFDLKKAGELTIGTRIRALSGIPRDTLARHHRYGAGESFLLPRGEIGRTPFETGVDIHLGYARKLSRGMEIEVFSDIINVLNDQGVASVDEQYSTASPSNPIVNGTYEDLVFAKENTPGSTGGGETSEPIRRNPNFGNVNGRYTPLSARFGVRLTF